jgi:hypothetical protein
MPIVGSFLFVSTVVGASILAGIPVFFLGVCAYDIYHEPIENKLHRNPHMIYTLNDDDDLCIYEKEKID